MANFFEQFHTDEPAPTTAAAPANFFAQFHPEAQPAPDVNVPVDVAKSFGVGVGKGAIGSAGTIGDIRSAISSGVDYLGNKLGISPETVQAGKQVFAGAFPGGQAIAAAPTSQAIRGAVEGITGPFYQPQSGLGEVAQTVGEYAPGAIAGPGGIARRAITQAVIPGLASEAAGQIYKGTELEPYARAVGGVGGALVGPGVSVAVRKAITPFPISAERQAALNTLQGEGVNVPAGMATGSKQLNAMQSQLGGAQHAENIEQMKDQYTAATLRKVGITDATRATPDVLNAADDRIGGVFDAVAARNPSIPIPGFSKVADAIAGDYQRLTGSENPYLNELRTKIGGVIAGDTYQATQSEIRRLAQASSSPELRNALFDMKRALDAAVQGGLPNKADAEVWKEARRQWGNLKTVEKAVSGSTDTAAQGLVTPAKLTQAMQSKSKLDYVRGRGDFADLARAGNQVMKEFPDSGTASRLAAMAKPAALGALFGAGAVTGGAGWLPTLGALAAPYVAGRAVTSGLGQRYLTNQYLQSTGTAPFRAGALLPYGAAINQLRRPEQQ